MWLSPYKYRKYYYPKVWFYQKKKAYLHFKNFNCILLTIITCFTSFNVEVFAPSILDNMVCTGYCNGVKSYH